METPAGHVRCLVRHALIPSACGNAIYATRNGFLVNGVACHRTAGIPACSLCGEPRADADRSQGAATRPAAPATLKCFESIRATRRRPADRRSHGLHSPLSCEAMPADIVTYPATKGGPTFRGRPPGTGLQVTHDLQSPEIRYPIAAHDSAPPFRAATVRERTANADDGAYCCTLT